MAGGWFNIYKGRGGATCLVDMMTKIFHDFGVPDIITSDSGPVFKSEKFKSCLRQYGVHHRLTSVGFAHANTRAELAVKSPWLCLPIGTLQTGIPASHQVGS